MLPFLTQYDPLGGSSGSIDPLGALQTYGSLADLLLPGVTTITTRSRSRQEREQLGEALTADDRRDCVSRALVMMEGAIPDVWDTKDLERLGKKLKTISRAVELVLPVVIDAIVVMEQFHEAVLAVFETLLWWGTLNAATVQSHARRAH